MAYHITDMLASTGTDQPCTTDSCQGVTKLLFCACLGFVMYICITKL